MSQTTPARLLPVFFLLFILAAHAAEAPAPTGASIDESLITHTLYVAPDGADGNPGTQDKPLKTLAKAAGLAFASQKAGTGVKVIIGTGVYREPPLAIQGNIQNGKNLAPVVFEAAEKGKAVISGSVVWNGWVEQGANWTHAWNYQWEELDEGTYPNGMGPSAMQIYAQQRAMIFINETPLRQALSERNLDSGTFYVNQKKKTVLLRPFGETDMKTAKIEVAVRQMLWRFTNERNVVMRGLVFHHDNSDPIDEIGAALDLEQCQNVMLEDCRFDWNNSMGLHIEKCRDLILRRCATNDNGCAGISGTELNNIVVDDGEASRNGWRSLPSGLYPATKGAFFWGIQRGLWRRYQALDNKAPGMSFGGSSNVTIEGCWVHGNLGGLRFDLSDGPILAAHNIICHNKIVPVPPGATSELPGTGLVIEHSSLVTLLGNICIGNEGAQIWVRDDPRRVYNPENPSKPMELHTRYLSLSHNVCVGLNAAQDTIHLPRQDFDHGNFATTFTASDNLFGSPTLFATSQGTGAIRADPQFMDAANHDFRLQPNSPVADWGLPTAPPT